MTLRTQLPAFSWRRMTAEDSRNTLVDEALEMSLPGVLAPGSVVIYPPRVIIYDTRVLAAKVTGA